MQSAFYSQKHPWLFMALAPSVVGTILILTPFALMGLVLIVPGVCGILGLIGLTMAWLGLVRPGIVSRRGGLILGFLACSLPAPLLGLSLLRGNIAYQQHFIDPMRGAGYASASFLLLWLFFFVVLLVQRHSTQGAPWRFIALLRVVGVAIAFVALIVPAGYVLHFAGYGKYIRDQQGAEARSMVSVTLRAVRQYQNLHADELPPDNQSAGLPSPEALHTRYVQSVRIAKGEVTLRYRNDPVAVLFGASTYGVLLSFRPAEEQGEHVLEENGGFWLCKATGYQNESDSPLFFDDLCDPSGPT
ncbi:hypothetical protein [Dyella silvatica]|uniref:hypothetical protein n=1 Tax=Dyella silvatica TaxID=2992128 RepID=UPI0022532DD8|nr:hypothetical protein [Dyella silvatica]